MFNLEFDGEIYRYAFSKPDGVLSWEDREYLLRETVKNIPKGRIGKPEDIGNAALFLALDESSFITGHNLVVDGGWTAK